MPLSLSVTRPVTRPVVSWARAIPPAASNNATPKAAAAPRMRFIGPLFRCVAGFMAGLALGLLRRGEGHGRRRRDRLTEQVRGGRVHRDDDGRAGGPRPTAGRRRDEGRARVLAGDVDRDG